MSTSSITPEKCARCGLEAEGFAMIGDDRLCHSDTRNCYEDEGWDLTMQRSPSRFLKGLL